MWQVFQCNFILISGLPILGGSPTATNITTTSVTLEWDAWDPEAGRGDRGDGPIVGYYIHYEHMSTQEKNTSRLISSANQTQSLFSWTIEFLEPATTYHIYVTAVREGPGGEGMPLNPDENLSRHIIYANSTGPNNHHRASNNSDNATTNLRANNHNSTTTTIIHTPINCTTTNIIRGHHSFDYNPISNHATISYSTYFNIIANQKSTATTIFNQSSNWWNGDTVSR